MELIVKKKHSPYKTKVVMQTNLGTFYFMEP